MSTLIKKWYGKNNISISIEVNDDIHLAKVYIYKSKHRTNTVIPGSYTDLSSKDLAIAMNLYHLNKTEIYKILSDVSSGKYDEILK